MDSTKIALDREAYAVLKSEKRPGETFSHVVKRLVKARKPLSAFVGSWDHLSEKEVEEVRTSLMAARRAARNEVRKRNSSGR